MGGSSAPQQRLLPQQNQPDACGPHLLLQGSPPPSSRPAGPSNASSAPWLRLLELLELLELPYPPSRFIPSV